MTAKVTYFPPNGDEADEIDIFGQHFTAEKQIEVSDDMAIRLMGNPFFEIENIPGSEPNVKRGPGRPSKASLAAAEQPAPEPDPLPPSKIPGPLPGES